MPSPSEIAWLIPVFPLFGAAFVSLLLVSFSLTMNRLSKPVALLLTSCIGISTVLSYSLLADQLSTHHGFTDFLFDTGDLLVPGLSIGTQIDLVSSFMLALVSTISILLMVFSHVYMSRKQGYVRFFVFLALFSSSLMSLLLSPGLIQVFLFWVLLGVFALLLSGFSQQKDAANAQQRMPFFAELTSDILFLVAIISLFKLTGSFGFDENISTLQAIVASGSLTSISLLLPCVLIFLSLIAKLSILPLSVFRVAGKIAIPSTSGVIQSLMLVSAVVFLSWRIEPLVVVASKTLAQAS